MNMRNTLILFLVFVALAVFAWTLRDRESKQFGNTAPEPTPGPMWEFAADEVSEVVVSRGSDEYTLSRDGGGWLVDGEPTNDEVDSLVGRIAEPTILRVLPEDRDPDTYGFDTPALTITFRVSDTETVLLRGDQVPTSNDYYVRLADGGPIRIWSGFDIDRLEEWLDEPPLPPTATPEMDEGAEGDADLDGDDADEGEGEAGADDGSEDADEEDDGAAGDEAEDGEEGDEDEEGESGTETPIASTTSTTSTPTSAATPSTTPTATSEPTPDDDEEASP